MRRLKWIIVGAAVVIMVAACTACGSLGESASVETATGGNAIVKTTIDKTEEATTEEKEAQAATEEKEEGENTEMADTREDAVENNMEDNYENYGEDEAWDEDDFSFDSILGIDQLDLKYEAHVAGFDGESFTYSVYTDDGVTDDKVDEIRRAIADFSSQSGDAENYMGYTDIQNDDAKILIYHDLGGVSEENCNAAIAGLLGALNNVPGIKQVIINEDMAGFDY